MRDRKTHSLKNLQFCEIKILLHIYLPDFGTCVWDWELGGVAVRVLASNL